MMRCIFCERGPFCQRFCIADFAFFVRKIAGGLTNYGFWVLLSLLLAYLNAFPAGFFLKPVFDGSDPGTPPG